MNPPRNTPSSPADTVAADRPRQVTAAHLSKVALVYIRQSSPKQVRDNIGSTEDQRALGQLARRWGWPEERIRVVEHDLGLSARTADRRFGFQSMLDQFDQGSVGIVFVRDVTRLSRDPLVSELFLTKAIRAGVLIYALGRVFDTATEDLAELFGLRIQSLLGWFENKSRARIMVGAKIAKVQQGFAVARPPIGYVRIVRGKWEKDPDADVRESIQRLVDLALEGYSIGKLMRYMREHQLRFPRRIKGQLVWEPPARSSIANLLSNPNYTPDYHYRRRRDVAATTKRGFRAVLRPDTEWLVYRDHHEGYLSREQWQSLQEGLRSRQPRNRPPLGKGSALLQGLVRCHDCDRWMSTMYHRRREGVRLPSYLCRRVDRWGRTTHYMVGPAEVIDGLVIKHVLTSLATVDHDTALRLLEDARAEQRTVQDHRRRLLRRAEGAVVTAKEQYLAVKHPEHQRVRADLEAAYEEAIRRRDEIKGVIEQTMENPAVAFRPEDAVQLATLTQQLNTLWEASTTSNEDRKQLLRLVLDRVVVLSSTTEGIELELVWTGGLRERLQMHRRIELDTKVRDLQQSGKEPGDIVDALQAARIPSMTGRPASREIVKRSLERLSLNEKAVRQRILARIRELFLDHRTRTQIMEVLDREFPRSRGRWRHDHLYTAVRHLQRGMPDIEPIPAETLKGPDMVPVKARIRALRKAGKKWREIADALNAEGLRPARAVKFSLFQVMELVRMRTR